MLDQLEQDMRAGDPIGANEGQQANYVVRLPVFEGPLDLLLHLIEKRQMEITTISLLAVTDQYLNYLRSWQDEQMPLANMAAFISIASRLLYIKSQSLLPHTSKEELAGEMESAAVMAEELRAHLLEYKLAKRSLNTCASAKRQVCKPTRVPACWLASKRSLPGRHPP